MRIFKNFICYGIIWAFICIDGLAQNEDIDNYYGQVAKVIGYSLNAYAEKYVLKKELKEISGLSFYKKGQLACVEDEHGKVYIYDLKEKEINQTIKFGKSGDYEGIEIIGKEVFVLRSDGTIFSFSLQNIPEVKTTSFKTPLSSKDDVEGLGFLAKDKQLLLACKEKSKFGDQKSNGKAVYPFDIKSEQLIIDPFSDLTIKNLNNFLESQSAIFKKIKEFKPSAIAIHPKTQQTFIVASVGKLLIVLNKERNLEQVIPLDPKLFKQPEGICFAPNGTMYISSEGQDGKGYILEFSYR